MVSSPHPLSVMRVFDIASQFYGFFRTQKILKSEELLPSFTFKQKYRKKKVHPFFFFFTSFLDNLKSLKVIFAWLTLMSALFPYGKILCPWCFSSHQLPWWKNFAPDFPALGKLFTCVYHTVRLQSWESSVWPLSFMDFFLGHRKSKNRRNLCRVSHLNKNIENKKMCILSQVFWRISSR